MITNNITEGQTIAIDSEIRIPIKTELLDKSVQTFSDSSIPVIYKVKRRETLYKISSVYFAQEIQKLVARNNINKLSLREGELLIVGWWNSNELSNMESPELVVTHTEPIILADTTKNMDSTIILVENSPFDSLNILKIEKKPELDTQVEHSKIASDIGIALWEKNDPDTESFLAMHKTAKIGSVIKLQNPVTDNIVVAQVIGHIPNNVYADDIDIIISKAVAQKLGALDSRFQIIMTYYE
jgi:hypothetical protein